MVSQKVVDLCTGSETVTSVLSKDPSRPPGDIPSKLWSKPNVVSRMIAKHEIKQELMQGDEPSQEELDMAAKCGKFTSRPSDLFLKMFRDVLLCFERDPMIGAVSPPLLASTGTIPISIVSVIPDIMRHYGDVIVRAEHEVMLATNFWQPSRSSHIITDSFLELNRRAGKLGRKIVVKLMYDRGTPKQAVENHTPVEPKDWKKVELPNEEDMPNLHFEVINFHRPLLGTFHAKYMVVDRKVAILSSNNIQDRPMMIHLEGPIVDSFFDMALLSWHNALRPPFPSLSGPLPTASSSPNNPTKFGQENPYVQSKDLEGSSKRAREDLKRQHEETVRMEQEEQEREGQDKGGAKDVSVKEAWTGGGGEDHTRQVEAGSETGRAFDREHQQFHSQGQSQQQGQPGGPETQGQPNAPAAAPDAAPTGTAPNDKDNAAEIRNMQNELHTSGDKETPAGIAAHLDIDTKVQPTDSQVEGGEFRPHILHKEHEPFPIAMVNRCPHGEPGHKDVRVPQDAAWLAGFKYAKKRVFIQTPTFNASPVIPATLDACRRGIECILYLDLGFNDQGEMIPYQGGTNEEVVAGMFKTLNEEGKGAQKNLKVYWYTSKDQTKPLNAKAKQRNCHVKFCAVDDTVAIVGNGNQDTQSWFHSQEINVMLDSPAVIAEWMAGLNANQNTARYGRVDDDGIWRYKEGEKKGQKLESLGETGGGSIGRLKGLAGAVARVRGTGGF